MLSDELKEMVLTTDHTSCYSEVVMLGIHQFKVSRKTKELCMYAHVSFMALKQVTYRYMQARLFLHSIPPVDIFRLSTSKRKWLFKHLKLINDQVTCLPLSSATVYMSLVPALVLRKVSDRGEHEERGKRCG